VAGRPDRAMRTMPPSPAVRRPNTRCAPYRYGLHTGPRIAPGSILEQGAGISIPPCCGRRGHRHRSDASFDATDEGARVRRKKIKQIVGGGRHRCSMLESTRIRRHHTSRSWMTRARSSNESRSRRHSAVFATY